MVLLVCRLIRSYVMFCYNGLKVQHGLHLPRSLTDGEPRLDSRPKGADGWNDFLIDRAYSELFSAHPEKRRERLSREITIAKTFWDLSSRVRSERLFKIVCDGWPELGKLLQNQP
jgi:hypothetical protein